MGLVRPDASTLAVLGLDGVVHHQVTYGPFGQAEQNSNLRHPYPKAFFGYLTYQPRLGVGLHLQVLDAGPRLYRRVARVAIGADANGAVAAAAVLAGRRWARQSFHTKRLHHNKSKTCRFWSLRATIFVVWLDDVVVGALLASASRANLGRVIFFV